MNKLKNFIASNISLVMISLSILGYIAAVYWFFWYGNKENTSAFSFCGDKEMFFKQYPSYLLWMTSLVIQPVIWLILFIPATLIIRKLREELKPEKHIWISFVLLVLLFVLFSRITELSFEEYFARPGSMLVEHVYKMRYFTIVSQVFGLYYMFGAVLISKVSIKKIYKQDYNIESYRKMKYYLDAVLNFTGIILSLGIISAILLKNTLNDEYLYSSELLISLGIMNSLLILIIYLPAHFTLLLYGRRILENKYKLDNPDSGSDLNIISKQEDLSKYLDLSLGISKSIKTSLVILSPVISSLIPNLLNIFQK